MKFDVFGAILLGGVGLMAFAVVESCKHESERCLKEHHGQAYTEERSIGKTDAGCIVSELTRYDAECIERDHVYVTNCRGSVSWDELHGKTMIRRSSQTD